MSELPQEGLLSKELPFTRVDALMVLGIGGNTQLLGPDRHPVIQEQRMRINAVAALELAFHHNIPKSALVITTGQFTELVEWHYNRLNERLHTTPDPKNFLQFRDAMGQPINEEELKRAAAVPQGDLMSGFIRRAVPKGGKGSGIDQEVLIEPIARNTILNFIETLNLLDERVGGVWEGNLAVLTTDTGHLQRSIEIGRALDLGEILPISSEETLLYYGYDRPYLTHMLEVSDSELREQEKNLRAISEIPEFVIPELVYVKNDDRLKNMLAHMSDLYGPQALEKFDLGNASQLSGVQIRDRIRRVGEERTRIAVDALSESDRQVLGIDKFDREHDIDKIRKVLASDVKATEKVRSALIAKYGDDSDWFDRQGLPEIRTTEAYRIKNWFFGRKLPPNSWRDSANLDRWRAQNIAYNKLTDQWIEETKSKGNV